MSWEFNLIPAPLTEEETPVLKFPKGCLTYRNCEDSDTQNNTECVF